MNLVVSLVLYIIAFIAIWFGAGLIIGAVDRIARRLRLSSFALSFFVLGLLTSIPETAVGINAVITRNPEIYVGTLMGGTVVIFLLIIPILAILGKGVRLNHDLGTKSLLALLAVIAAPGLIIVDHKATVLEAGLLVAAYLLVFYLIQRKHGVLEEPQKDILLIKTYSFLDLARVAGGIAIVFVSSQFIVSQTSAFAEMLHAPAYYLSLIILSLGTNLPELSLAVRAIMSGKKDIAFGDYLGSAAANTLLFGVFTLASSGAVFGFDNFLATFLFMVLGLFLFYFFAQSQKAISIKEGIILLLVYFSFIFYEICKGLM